MDAQDVRSLQQGNRVERGGAVEGVGGRAADEFVYHRLAGDAHKERQVELAEVSDVAHQIVVVLEGLAETETGVEDNVVCPQLAQAFHLFRQKEKDLSQEVIVVGRLLHGGRRSLNVHQDVRHAQAGHRAEHIIVHRTARNIVDDICATFFHTHTRHVSAERINGNGYIGSEAAHNLQPPAQPRHFLLRAYVVCPGARRVGTDVDHRAPFVEDFLHAVLNLRFGLLAAACVERVGRYVENAHYLRAGQFDEPPAAVDGVWNEWGHKDSKK